ncbi:MAG: ABC transporter permease [Candidatus Aminicenantes bacterium]|nr:ABC transporter permease [Candidatus Aminicenantes bacterium]
MFRNNLKIAFRIFKRHKGYSFINITGLAVGMACCILILLWINDEVSYDRYHENADQIIRLTYAEEIGGTYSHYAMSPFVAAPIFKDEIPEVEAYTRLISNSTLIKYGDKIFDEDNVYHADPDFFKIFSYEFIAGDPDSALLDPGSIVLTESSARKIFGTQDPMGETLNLSFPGDVKVTGIIRDVPENSHFHFNYLIPLGNLEKRVERYFTQWNTIIGWSYLLVQEGTDLAVVAQKLQAVAETHSGIEARKFGQTIEYYPQKITDIHLKSRFLAEIEPNGNILYVYVFSIIALFILVIACINFMNLSTARSANRGREVGLRKVFGAQRKRLVSQFITETIGLAVVGLGIALNLVWLLLPTFNNLTGKDMHINDLNNGAVWLGLLGLILVTGVVAGSYPAFYLSAFQPIQVLRGKLQKGSRRSSLRNGLVTFQFTISIMLIISTFIVLGQLNHMKNKALGFNKEQMLVVRLSRSSFEKSYEAFKNTLLKNPQIVSASYSDGLPGRVGRVLTVFQEGKAESESHNFDVITADYNFLKTYEIDLAEGRNFSKDFSTDSAGAFLLNETGAAKLGLGMEAIGTQIGFDSENLFPILGITKDFHYRSLKDVIGPLAIQLTTDFEPLLSLRISTENLTNTLASIEGIWNEFDKERAFNYFFVDENFDALYHSETRLSKIITVFALIAIFVACLGLFGLASFTVEQSTKEIGIRKVLGASINTLVFQLSWQFTKWVLVANIIAWPVTYLLMNNYWLVNFPFKIGLSIFIFLSAGLISLFIALLTVSFQSIKAALTNPADSLRNE